MQELSFLVETAPDKECEKDEIEALNQQRINARKLTQEKWKSRNRDYLAQYAKDYRISYCGQSKG
jgi:hypothetical protein